MNVVSFLGRLLAVFLFGFFGIIGGYLSYRKKDTQQEFYKYYFWKPYVISLVLMLSIGNVLGLIGFLGTIFSVVLINLVVYYSVDKYE